MAARPDQAPPSTGDAIVALATFGLTLGAAAIRPDGGQPGVALVAVLAALGPCVALVYRSWWPAAVFGIALAAWIVASLAGEGLPGVFPVAVALYTLAVVRGRTPTLVAWGIATLVATVQGPPFGDPPTNVLQALPYGLLFGSALGAVGFYGLYQGTRRVYVATLEERTRHLERERELVARAAVAQERVRISRELHDVVAHHVSVMVIQAGAAESILPTEAADARMAIASVRSTGREALAEMRRMVHVLRDKEGSTAGSSGRMPEPGLAGLDALTSRLCEAGLEVEIERTGDARAMPAALDISAYRIVQEALTNVLRHAGSGAQAHVTIRVDARELSLEVTDDGHGLRQADAGTVVAPVGHGLTVMRERVGLFGGDLSTGDGPAGGFCVAARLPLPPAEVTEDATADGPSDLPAGTPVDLPAGTPADATRRQAAAAQ
jgi:signal transduction histidine kinase